MAIFRVIICAITITIMISSIWTVDCSAEHSNNLSWLHSSRSNCKAGSTLADCIISADEEFELDSEIHRRILATTKYISYGALQKNTVPCSQRGASYYNCKPGAQANPYSRGCSAITKCKS